MISTVVLIHFVSALNYSYIYSNYKIIIPKINSGGQCVVLMKHMTHTYRMLVDTGSIDTYIDITRTETSKLPWKPLYQLHGSNLIGTQDILKKCEFRNVMIGNMEIDKIVVLSIDLTFNNSARAQHKMEPIDGILGCDVMLKTSMVIDMKNKLIYVK